MNWKRSILGIGLAGSCFILSLVLILAVIVAVIEKNIVFIRPDERGVVLSYGAPAGYPKVLTPGPYWLPPGEHAVIYTISPETYTTLSYAPDSGAIRVRPREGDDILIHVSATYAIDPEKVLDLHITWQDRYKDGLVRPLTRQTTRKIVSQYTANEIEVNRANIEGLIAEALEQKFAENYLILLDFKIISIQPYD